MSNHKTKTIGYNYQCTQCFKEYEYNETVGYCKTFCSSWCDAYNDGLEESKKILRSIVKIKDRHIQEAEKGAKSYYSCSDEIYAVAEDFDLDILQHYCEFCLTRFQVVDREKICKRCNYLYWEIKEAEWIWKQKDILTPQYE